MCLPLQKTFVRLLHALHFVWVSKCVRSPWYLACAHPLFVFIYSNPSKYTYICFVIYFTYPFLTLLRLKWVCMCVRKEENGLGFRFTGVRNGYGEGICELVQAMWKASNATSKITNNHWPAITHNATVRQSLVVQPYAHACYCYISSCLDSLYRNHTHTYGFKNITSVIGKKSAVMEIQKALYLLKHDQREGWVIFYRARSVFKSCNEYSWDIVFHYLALASKMPTHTK